MKFSRVLPPWKAGLLKRVIWDPFVLLVILISVMELPFDLLLGEQWPPPGFSQEKIRFDIAVYLIFFLDMIGNCLFVPEGSGFTTVREVVRNYFFSKKYKKWYIPSFWFVIDFLATFPFDLLFSGAAFSIFGGARVARLLRVVRISRILSGSSKLSHTLQDYPSVKRLVLYLLLLFLVIHAIACLFFALEYQSPQQVKLMSDIGTFANVFVNYTKSVYWCVVTISTVGYGDVSPVTEGGRWLALACMILGVGTYSIISANLASAFLRMDQIEKKREWEKAEILRDLRRVAEKYSLEREIDEYIQYKDEDYERYLDMELAKKLPGDLSQVIESKIEHKSCSTVDWQNMIAGLLHREFFLYQKGEHPFQEHMEKISTEREYTRNLTEEDFFDIWTELTHLVILNKDQKLDNQSE